MKKYILLVSHGSREKSANREFKRITREYGAKHPGWKVTCAYLELASPSIPEALESLIQKAKPKAIILLPFFLFSARHVKKDIPGILKTFRKKHPGTKIRMAKPLGPDPRLLSILDRRVVETAK